MSAVGDRAFYAADLVVCSCGSRRLVGVTIETISGSSAYVVEFSCARCMSSIKQSTLETASILREQAR
jgi:hypothetical protein